MRTLHLLLPAASSTLALSACGGGSPPPIDTAEPTATRPRASRRHAGSGPGSSRPPPACTSARCTSRLSDDGTTLADVTVTQTAAVVVPILTEVLGAEPIISDHAGGLETAPSRWYDWSGFALIDPRD